MDTFRRYAVFTLARDASFVALAAGTLMVGFSFVPAIAFNIAASIALIFSVALALRGLLLTEDGVRRSEVWSALEPHERPEGEDGERWARDQLQDLLLQFAKSAAALAIALYSSSLLSSLGAEESTHAVLTASLN